MKKYYIFVYLSILFIIYLKPNFLKAQQFYNILNAKLIPVINNHSFGEEFYVDIKIEDVTDLFGISFQLNYPSQYLRALSSEQGDILGTQIIYYDNIDSSSNIVSIGITKTGDQNGFTGSGIMAKIKFKEKPLTQNGTVINYSLNNISANDPSGIPLSITPFESSYTVGYLTPLIFPIVNTHSLHEEFEIFIDVENVQNLFGVSFKLVFPFDKLEILSSQKGDFLGSNVIYYDNINNTNGNISIGISKTGNQSGSNGAGTIAKIRVKECNSVTSGTEINLNLSEISANDDVGNTISLTKQDTFYIAPKPTSVKNKNYQLKENFLLCPNYPNPFNPSTTISYILPRSSKVALRIYDLTGQKVRTLVDDNQDAGIHVLKWNALDDNGHRVSSGVYLCQLIAGHIVLNKKLTFVK